MPWEYPPRELDCGGGMTCWRCLDEWMQAGVGQSVHEAVLCRLASTTRSCRIEPMPRPLACQLRSVGCTPAETRLIAASSKVHQGYSYQLPMCGRTAAIASISIMAAGSYRALISAIVSAG
ncbi:hypothetical protein F2P44_32980 [Massilia sp. CCM 8695]|uniref:Uncharacterized protein n=1 Tax=Massilia frigida TaxID=2609281 RepID=A0ABX0NK94_9BURK|nr:hypothetical protein [Massilia frigida]